MRQIIYVFLFTCVTKSNTIAQPGMDKLAKYSYYVFGSQMTADNHSMQRVEGTCFFFRSGQKTFLVSASHLMTGWRTSDNHKEMLYPDTLYVRFPATDVTTVHDYPIDIVAYKANVAGDFYYNHPDIFVMEFQDAANYDINIIEEINGGALPAATGINVIVNGFPAQGASMLKGTVFSSPAENLSYHDSQRNTPVRDTINYLVKCGDPVQPGFSGAPVFLLHDLTGQWLFGGVVSQGVPVGNYFFVVKPAYILENYCLRSPGPS